MRLPIYLRHQIRHSHSPVLSFLPILYFSCLQHLYLYFLPSLTFSAPPPYPLISAPSLSELFLFLSSHRVVTVAEWSACWEASRLAKNLCVCVYVRVCEFKRITALVCQRELASIFLSLLCIALSDSTASTAQSKKHFQSRCIKREGKGEEGGGNAMS